MATQLESSSIEFDFGEAAFQGGLEIIALVDSSGQLKFGNQAFHRLEEGQDPAEMQPVLTRQSIIQACRQAYRNQADHCFEIKGSSVHSPDGWYQCRITLLQNRNSEVIGTRAICFDISAGKKGDERLERNSRLFDEVQRVATLGVWEWKVHEPNVVWTDELYRIYGLHPDRHQPTYDSYLEKVHPDDRERVRSTMESVFRDHSSFSHDERILRPDGAIRHLHTWGHAEVDESGQLTGLVGVCQDITASVRATQEIEAERRKFELLASISRTLASTLEYSATLEHVARFVIPVLADWCAVFRLTEAGKVEPVTTAHVDPELAPVAVDQFSPKPEDFYRAETVIKTGKSIAEPDITEESLQEATVNPVHLERLRKIQPQSCLLIPLAARDKILGAISLNYSTSNRHYSPKDLDLAEEIGRRAAIAIDNSLLYCDAQKAIQVRDDFIANAVSQLNPILTALTTEFQQLKCLISSSAPDSLSQFHELEHLIEALNQAYGRVTRSADDMHDKFA
ncbi:PAS domain-containing protein [Oligoflexus tunisiensis]|uniref:PAS domain-containing protein n=1 Tax=Oligoflexus tunisiensis TaxID=708132 RepID=UPI00114D073C|nr:PAS domain-containing protein [Oligoflexus tunisiensis]